MWKMVLSVGVCLLLVASLSAQKQPGKNKPNRKQNQQDGRNRSTGKPPAVKDPALAQYGIYARTAPRAKQTDPVETSLPLKLEKGQKIVFIGNGFLEQSQDHGYFETLIQQTHPKLNLRVRNLAWSGDTPSLQPRPANFADLDQHLTHEKADVIFASYGFNESFAGAAGVEAFREELAEHVRKLKTSAFNGNTGPKIVLLSPTPAENHPDNPAADRNSINLKMYAKVVEEVATSEKVGFIDLISPLEMLMNTGGAGEKIHLTDNGVHLNQQGYKLAAAILYQQSIRRFSPEDFNEEIRETVIDKNFQFFRRYRPLNTFYYTGDRNKSYGYLDFLPAMRNFDIMVDNRDQRIWSLAQGLKVPDKVDDTNVPELPKTTESRGANRWVTAKEELDAFKVDPRFEVTLFAGEEEFPDIAAPIQIRWDSKGRLWVSTSTTYPHVYPGHEPADKLVILEDTDGDGKADKSSVFADKLHIPLSFEFGDGGVYVSEMPHLTFLKDTDGDGKADLRKKVLTGFGTEDSHHSLHDFIWTPDGDLLWRESIFHHSQVETAYGPVRQRNSGWFRFDTRRQQLTSFGTYHSTNPWGVTFDDWGQHVASHPIYAQAFHSLDPPYPTQHPRPGGLRAYSGTAGQEFVDFPSFPAALQGGYIKARYKPTNRIEIHKWKETEFGYDEEYVSDLIFSTNLSFIPVDIRFGPRGALYLCDWYNPIKGHAQYSLRDERRDRHSGRIWRVTAKGQPLNDPPKIAERTDAELLQLLQRPEGRYRYWVRRELRDRHFNTASPQNTSPVQSALDAWVKTLSPKDARYRHHQTEALWMYRTIDADDSPVAHQILRDLLTCEEHRARAAATHQLRSLYSYLPDHLRLLRKSMNDSNAIVRMEAVIAASYIGSKPALEILMDVFNHPQGGHLTYAVTCSLGSETLRRHWEGNPAYQVDALLKKARASNVLKEPKPTQEQAKWDKRRNLQTVRVSCLPERMRFTNTQFTALTGQPVKLVFSNPDATDHNLVIVKPDSLEEVGTAANLMAKDPKNANSDFLPPDKKHLILQASPMIGPTRNSRIHVMRFETPDEPGIYPFVCTFPGHWVIMKGEMLVVDHLEDVPELLANRKTPAFVKKWSLADFSDDDLKAKADPMAGIQAFAKAKCNQCHVVAGHGINLGPELTHVKKNFTGRKLLQQILEPSAEINKKYRPHQFLMRSGRTHTGVIKQEDKETVELIANLLTPLVVTTLKRSDIDEQFPSRISSMPVGLTEILTKEEILNLLAYLENGGVNLPDHLKHNHKNPDDICGPGWSTFDGTKP